MHKYLVLILGVVVAGIVGLSSWQAAEPTDNTIGAAGIGDPYFPDLGNGGYDAQHFVIDLDASVANKTIRGTVTMTARATQNLTQFNLDFLGFTIHSLQVNGTNAHYQREKRELIITAPQMLKQGDTFTVTVTYSGNPDENRKSASRPFSTGWASYSGGVYVASEPDGASLWYPVNDHPLDKATYRFIITVEKPYIVATNGLLQETRDEGNFYTFVWETRDLTASYLVTVNISKFDRVEEEGDLVPIRNFFPSGQAVQGQLAFQETEAMINFYSAAFGAYPFEVYGAVVADTQLPFALETQTLSLFGKNVITGNREYSEIIIAHELAHQWWGNSISVHSWRDIWLNEGFATYTSALWVEHRHGKEAFEKLMENWYSLISSPIFRANAAIVGDPTPTKLFDMAVYYRGAWALHALRLKIGDAAFFTVLKTYYEQHKQGNAQIADFIRVAEQVSGQKLGDFFQVWLYQKELPAR